MGIFIKIGNVMWGIGLISLLENRGDMIIELRKFVVLF